MKPAWDNRDDAADEFDEQVLRAYRSNGPPEPSDEAWRATLARIEAGLSAAPRSRRRWPGVLGVAVSVAAAALAGVLLARGLWPQPTPAGPQERSVLSQLAADDNNDEPFAVVSAAEVSVLRMNAGEADRLVMDGPPLLGSFELATPGDIEVVAAEPDSDDVWMPKLKRGPEVPMIVRARADVDDDEP